MESAPHESLYIGLATFVFLMLVGSVLGIPQLVLFAGGAAFPLGLHHLKQEAQARNRRGR